MAKINKYTAAQIEAELDKVGKKQDRLVSGTNIKTINGQSIVGSGNIEIQGGGGGGTTDYNALTNKPSINGHELIGDMSPHDIDVQEEMSDQCEYSENNICVLNANGDKTMLEIFGATDEHAGVMTAEHAKKLDCMTVEKDDVIIEASNTSIRMLPGNLYIEAGASININGETGLFCDNDIVADGDLISHGEVKFNVNGNEASLNDLALKEGKYDFVTYVNPSFGNVSSYIYKRPTIVDCGKTQMVEIAAVTTMYYEVAFDVPANIDVILRGNAVTIPIIGEADVTKRRLYSFMNGTLVVGNFE